VEPQRHDCLGGTLPTQNQGKNPFFAFDDFESHHKQRKDFDNHDLKNRFFAT